MKKDKLDRAFDDLIDVIDQKNLKNYVTIILDRSGSMQSMRREAVDMFNEQVDALKKNTGEMQTFVSLVTFAAVVDEPDIWCEDVMKFPRLDLENYVPSGGTALRDAIGGTIRRFQTGDMIDDPNSSFLVIIITDGEENMSRNFSSKDLAELIQSMQETKKWTFSYVGANVDFSKIVEDTNIHLGNVASCSYSTGASISAGTGGISEYLTRGIENYMNSRTVGETFTSNLYDGCVSNEHVSVNPDKKEDNK